MDESDGVGITPPPGTTELGIDIIKVSRIRDSLARGTDVDQPRNLAKSVTVE